MSALIRALQDPGCYSHPVDRIRVIETHISWVLLTGPYAYKIKKPVKLGFLDFSTLGQRRHFCEEELRLNRRFAPDIYLAVVPIGGTEAHPRLGADASPLEYALQMKQFSQDDLFDNRLAQGALSPAHVDTLADRCGAFHAGAAIEPLRAEAMDDVLKLALDNCAVLHDAVADSALAERVATLEQWTRHEFQRLRTVLITRAASGRVRECHGDLHLRNIALIDERPVLFDCVEFDERLRLIDVISEIAFLVMDFCCHARHDYAYRFLNRYLETCGDYDGLRVLRFFLVYRALVRAKIAYVSAQQTHGDEVATHHKAIGAHINLAHTFTRASNRLLAITHGLSGSGKSTAAQFALSHARMIRLRSDVERKRIFHLAADADSHSPFGQGIYSAQANDATYARLATLARKTIEAGFPAIVDAAFPLSAQRDRFQALARQLDAQFIIVRCVSPAEKLVRRIEQRRAEGNDPSEASVAILRHQQAHVQPLTAEELTRTADVDTDEPSSLARMAQRLERLAWC
jgi:hypothetical protein